MRIQLSDIIDLKKTTSFPVLFHATSTYYMDSFTNGIYPDNKPLNYDLINSMMDELSAAASKNEITIDGIDDYKSKRDHQLHNYRYGGFFLTNSAFRLGLYLNENGMRGIGEILIYVIKAYSDYHKKTNEHYCFNVEGADEFLKSFYDFENNTVKNSIKPMVLCIYSTPISDIASEDGKKLDGETLPMGKLLRAIPGGTHRIMELKNDHSLKITVKEYLRSQNSWEYIGPVINRNRYDIIEFDPEELNELSGDQYLNYIFGKL